MRKSIWFFIFLWGALLQYPCFADDFVSSYIYDLQTGAPAVLSGTGSGTHASPFQFMVTGSGGSGGTSSSFSSAFPATGTAVGITDGTNMQPLKGDTTNGLWVNLKASISLPVTGTFWQATQPVSLTSLPALSAGSAKVGIFTTDQTTPGTTDLVHAAQNGTWTVQPGNTANTTAWKVDNSAVNQPIIDLSTATTAASFTRPANTTAYASGQLVANSTTAGSVTAMSFTASRANNTTVTIFRVHLQKSTTSTTNAQFRVHLLNVSPTFTNGDGGTLSMIGSANQIGYTDIDMSQEAVFSDGAVGIGQPAVGSAMIALPATGTQTIYAVIEARGAYTPGNAEVFKCWLELVQS